jgi:hypothetical protein
MAKEPKRIDISRMPELLSIVHKVQQTNEPYVLQEEYKDVALVTPIQPGGKRGSKGKLLTFADPLWKLVGKATEAKFTDSAKKHEYLAEA